MIHVPALPGSPFHELSMDKILETCLKEARIYKECGVDAIAIENMHDVPYLNKTIGPETISCMSVVAWEVKKEFSCGPVGIQILAAANKAALAVALAARLDFIRAEGFVFGHLADEGYIESCAGELLRYRKNIGNPKILILTDIKKKHSSHSITSDIDIVETARAAEFFATDGVIITGLHTGDAPDLEIVKNVKKSVRVPVLIGSGITCENFPAFLPYADAFIVGSFFKKEGFWKNELDTERIKRFMDVARKNRI